MMRPQLVAHRGDAENYPENSLPALQAAVDCGVRCLEFDAQLTADAVPVVIHDADLRRTGERPLSVLDTPWETLRACSVGEPARFADRFNEVRMPTLERVGCWLREWPDVTAFVELKPESLQRYGMQTLLDKVAAVLQLRPGASLDVDTIKAYVKSQLAAFKVPAHVVLQTEPLPRNAAGKVLKKQLRSEMGNT